jgi:hypothetical protein
MEWLTTKDIIVFTSPTALSEADSKNLQVKIADAVAAGLPVMLHGGEKLDVLRYVATH